MPLIAWSCVRPDGVLSNRQMVDVLVDLHTAEGVLQVAGYNYGHETDTKIYYGIILEQHGITQAQFDSSLVWYTAHPQYFQSVYPKVLKRLQKQYDTETARLAELDSLLLIERNDSLVRETQVIPRLPLEEELRNFVYGLDPSLYRRSEGTPADMDSLYAVQHAYLDSIETVRCDSLFTIYADSVQLAYSDSVLRCSGDTVLPQLLDSLRTLLRADYECMPAERDKE